MDRWRKDKVGVKSTIAIKLQRGGSGLVKGLVGHEKGESHTFIKYRSLANGITYPNTRFPFFFFFFF